MATGLYSGVSGLAIGVGLNKGVTGLWSGASGLITGWGATAFNPLSLFASGEQGAWYDPSDLSTMFQDTAGTTPVTATGQTVGLLLDKSKGLVLGPELVTNGDFSGGTTGWTAGPNATLSVISGALRTTGTVGYAASNQQIATVAGKWYELRFDIVGGSGMDRYRFRLNVNPSDINNAAVNLLDGASTTGTKTFRFLAPNNNLWFTTFAGVTAGSSVDIDNVSVKELPGNHATQATAASRPIYGIEPFGGRRNLLTFTEQFDNAAWSKASATVTPDNATAPNGTTTADLLIPTAINNDHGVYRSVALSANSVVSVYAKQGPGIYKLALHPDGGNTRAVFNLQTGVVDVNDSGQTATITSVGDGWYRASLTVSSAATFIKIYVANASNQVTFIGDGTSGIFIWGAQLETGSTATAYQRVTDQWNVTQAGVPSVSYLAFDGTDDFLLTGTITPGIDKAQVFAGVRKLSSPMAGVFLESSTDSFANNGALAVFAPSGSGGTDYFFRSKGTVFSDVSANGYVAPVTNVITGIGDIAGDRATLRVNGTQVAQTTTDQGTGNYLAYPLYIGRRGGTVLPFNGRIYQMIVRFGANLSAATITQTENYTAGKTGIYTVEQLNRISALTSDGTSYSAYAASDSSGNNYRVTATVLSSNGTSYQV